MSDVRRAAVGRPRRRRAYRRAAVAALTATALTIAAGCGGSSGDEAATEATTTQAPATTVAPPPELPPGDVAAGSIYFEANCSSCHIDGGRGVGGVGPPLARPGITEQGIRAQVRQGGGGMPAGLAEGQDLADVTEYVLSLQGP